MKTISSKYNGDNLIPVAMYYDRSHGIDKAFNYHIYQVEPFDTIKFGGSKSEKVIRKIIQKSFEESIIKKYLIPTN